MKQRIISMLLVLCMLLSALPISASATEIEPEHVHSSDCEHANEAVSTESSAGAAVDTEREDTLSVSADGTANSPNESGEPEETPSADAESGDASDKTEKAVPEARKAVVRASSEGTVCGDLLILNGGTYGAYFTYDAQTTKSF